VTDQAARARDEAATGESRRERGSAWVTPRALAAYRARANTRLTRAGRVRDATQDQTARHDRVGRVEVQRIFAEDRVLKPGKPCERTSGHLSCGPVKSDSYPPHTEQD